MNSNRIKLYGTLTIGVIAFILQFAFHQALAAQWIISILGTILALIMFIDMIKVLKSGNFGVDLLAITAIVATIALGEYWAGWIVLLMLTGGDTLEEYAANKAKSELKSLLDNSPSKAHVYQGESIKDVDIEHVKVGDKLLIRPKEQVPVDGIVYEGNSSVDESSLTGESVPVDIEKGSHVMSGSINGEVPFKITAEKIAAESEYQAIVKLVKESETNPARFVRLADRYAVPFTIIAYIIAGLAWYLSGDPIRIAQVLVVASPCPLILAAPIAFVSGMSRSSRNGIIVKSGTALEKISSAKTMAFDKTGTITRGHLVVQDVKISPDFMPETVYQYAASIEQNSSHVMAEAIVDYALAQQIEMKDVDDVKEITAEGIVGVIDGHYVKVGNPEFVTKYPVEKVEGSSVYVSIDERFAGVYSLVDEIRPEAKETIARLKTYGFNNILMITGDKKETTEKVASEVGITKAYPSSLPADKVKIIQTLPKEYHPAVMVGDGVNDAPALALADVGIAMGYKGANAASESADAVVLKDDLGKVAEVAKISDDTLKVAKQAVLIGILICIILMLIAGFGLIPTIIGAMLQEVVDTVTILYALRARSDNL
ncbi:heavy metal translocating P-type ATPase [Companilactobacillus sp.]|jgi:heavy metal translocating P-type ATPase|uniref:heavy metal translocating P-type ATPase n=1 Tax=Companilactobacillus sp. TaxID=2767905 RepID=UPI0025BBCCD8|nr:heavy metal translocating P-type ATPase [Companilactobacillus sp.]MCH4007905.1 cadmium-translocating P-type ATPase [Companilactobacillus sp.]MCH4051916.1 cadmium-translocating P-type ATPase [Companilactobacillus sp.]MCH4075848.1 cadmium-translocating P-type ATPase [Companilactobacillus sp.]MCH4124423.1 cadmium-translocating P-type ATPase [Companilactobacillus sp.]MCH4132614.1 cadmium-translocating P-type ATPase [Companilactobacillus sp.]